MSQQRLWPFRRVSVDNMIRGVTRVWWQLEPLFNDPGPRVFQLQVGNTGLRDATDWRDVGAPIIDGYMAYDDVWRASGSELTTHYRVTLTTGKDIYVSQAVNCSGELAERDWILAREVLRKEQLRHRYVSVDGYLLKAYRFGRPCSRCRDQLTGEVLDSNCPICNGTSFEVGYHPPLPLQCWDLSLQTIEEQVDGELKGTTRNNAEVRARVIGFPAISRHDIWINGKSDERWFIQKIEVAAAFRGVPVIYNVTMGLVPLTNSVYAIEVGGEPAERPGPVLPNIGCGLVTVDHNFGGLDYLAYRDAMGYSIVGATIYVFTQIALEAAYPDFPNRALAIAQTTTRANGRWSDALQIDPGDYGVLYEKPGEYGPNTQYITVYAPNVTPTETWVTAAVIGDASSGLETEIDEPIVTEQPVRVPVSEAVEEIDAQTTPYLVFAPPLPAVTPGSSSSSSSSAAPRLPSGDDFWNF